MSATTGPRPRRSGRAQLMVVEPTQRSCDRGGRGSDATPKCGVDATPRLRLESVGDFDQLPHERFEAIHQLIELAQALRTGAAIDGARGQIGDPQPYRNDGQDRGT